MEIEITLEMKKQIYDKHSERPPITAYEVGLCEGIETALEAMKVDCGFLGEMAFMDESGMVTELTDECKTWLSKKYNAQQTTAYGKEGIREGIEFVLNVVGIYKAFLEETDMEKAKHFCWECKVNEIPEPEYCCGGFECGCYGQPIDPPYCDDCIEQKTGWKLVKE